MHWLFHPCPAGLQQPQQQQPALSRAPRACSPFAEPPPPPPGYLPPLANPGGCGGGGGAGHGG